MAQHKIELNIIIPLTHHAKYRLNLNYIIVIKQNIDRLLATRFIQSIGKATWLSSKVVLPKKNAKLRICIDFRKLNVAIKKDPYPLPFTDEVLNIITRYEDIVKYL